MTKTEHEFCDFDDNKLGIGDTVVLMTAPREFGSVFLMKGVVTNFSPKSVRIKCEGGKEVSRQPHRIAKINP